MDGKQADEARAKHRRVKIREGNKTVFGYIFNVRGNFVTIKPEGDEGLIYRSVWEIELAK